MMNPAMLAAMKTSDPTGGLAIWSVLHLSELGFGLRVTDDGIHAVARVRTLWANPDDVVAEVEKRLNDLAGGKADALADIQSVADKHSDAPLARDLKAGPAGLVAPFVLVGAGAFLMMRSVTEYRDAVAAVPTEPAAPVDLNNPLATPPATPGTPPTPGTPATPATPGTTATPATPATPGTVPATASVEGRLMARKVFEMARQFALAHKGKKPLPKGSTEPTPALGTCCAAPDHRCKPDAKLWAKDPWKSFKFSISEPSAYSVQYVPAPDGKSFTVRAIGDLDCDGQYATFETVGKIQSGGEVTGGFDVKQSGAPQ
jgi:hypothetical protein